MFIPQSILVSVLNTVAKWPQALDIEEILGLWRDVGAIVGTSALVSWAVLEIGVAIMVISGIFLERLRERRARNRKVLAEIEELEKRNGAFRKQEERARAEGEEWDRIRAERDSLKARVEQLEEWGRIRAERDSLKARVEQLEQWGERYRAAIAGGKPFDEPMPASNGEDSSEEHPPMR